jgi:hypothetical protein
MRAVGSGLLGAGAAVAAFGEGAAEALAGVGSSIAGAGRSIAASSRRFIYDVNPPSRLKRLAAGGAILFHTAIQPAIGVVTHPAEIPKIYAEMVQEELQGAVDLANEGRQLEAENPMGMPIPTSLIFRPPPKMIVVIVVLGW